MGVQIRPLREVIKEYDGEVCMLRFKEGWTGKTIDPNDAVRAATQIWLRRFGSERVSHARDCVQRQQAWLMRELTRMHELFYGRSYTCNCFLCLATIFPRFASCAKWMSRCCGCLCCGQIDAFREDCVKCSQLAANIYQAMGLMDPLINPSSVLPVDFLPGELLQSPEGDDGHALHDSMQFHL